MDNYLSLAKKTVEEYIRTGKVIPLPDNLPKEMLNHRAGVFVSIHKRSRGGFAPSTAPLGKAQSRHRPEPRLLPHSLVDGLETEELRGCIGTYLPAQPDIAQEIIHNAIEAATQDPRFPPITPDELSSLTYSVDILSKPQLTTKNGLDPKRYGVIVQARDGRRGLLLPDLEGVEAVEQQISICRQKAGITENESVTLYRFTVERHCKD